MTRAQKLAALVRAAPRRAYQAGMLRQFTPMRVLLRKEGWLA
jgi:hypothetical protein